VAGKNLLYVDGVLQKESSDHVYGSGFESVNSPLSIGYLDFNSVPGFFYRGDLDEIALYDIALPPGVIQQHYAQDTGRGYCNQVPVITSTAGDSATEESEYTYSPTATDFETDVVSWSLEDEPSGMIIDSGSGSISWTPDNIADSGSVKLIADDGHGGTATEVFTVVVTPVNDKPVITTTAGTSVTLGNVYTYNPSATDEEGNTLTWSLSSEPTGMTINSSTGAISWTPGEGVLTSGPVTLTVDDGQPVNNTATETFTVNVTVDSDLDGISDSEEGGATYDGNGDGVPDADQINVVTLFTFDDKYSITLAAPNGTQITNILAADNPSVADAPQSIEFDYGFVDFGVTGITGATTVTIYLPEGALPTTYYVYGKTLDNPSDHWYEFLFDAQTQTGAKISGNVITLHFVDGLRGDDDLTVNNGIIHTLGAPGFDTSNQSNNADQDGDGSGSGCFIGSTAIK